MKQLLRFLIVILVLAGLVLGCAWYFLDYNLDWTVQFLTTQGKNASADGKLDSAIRYYTWAEKLRPQDQALDIALANVYKAKGNYTKAEYTLANAISEGGSVDVYIALCQIYVEQDKLLDAVTMLDQIADPNVKAQLDAARPAAPSADLEPGFYTQYMDLVLQADSGTIYASGTREYPTMKHPYDGPIPLGLGETRVTALAVNGSGLVSPLSVFGYTISGVVEEVQLNDAALDAYVRDLLSRSSGSTLNTADLWSITEMVIPAEVQDLSQMSYFTGLTALTLTEHSADLSFLSSMTGLTKLNLSGCTFETEQLSLVGNLSQLTELNLSGCQLSTIQGLEPLTTLTFLDLSQNSLKDLSPISGNTGMDTLLLQGNAVSNISFLTGMHSLRVLNLSGNSLKDSGPVSACTALEELDVSVNNLSSLKGVDKLSGLVKLNASRNKLTTVEGLGSCVNLVELVLSDNTLEEIDSLVTLVNLETLDVSYNDIVTVPEFPDDAALSLFDGSHNFIEDVSGLAGMVHLNFVFLDYNNLSDINVLASCPNLVQINVFRTNVDDISKLDGKDIIISYNPT